MKAAARRLLAEDIACRARAPVPCKRRVHNSEGLVFVVPSERAAAENEKIAAVFLGRPGRAGRPIAIDVVNGSHFYPSPQLLSP